MKIGFVGIGNMGYPMALNLMKAGFEVYGKNRSQPAEDKLKAAGGKVGFSLVELSKEMDVIITCLPMPSDVEEVYLGGTGLLTEAKQGQVFIDCSTVSPELNQKLFHAAVEKDCEYLDVPVSGGTTGAEAGSLSMMAGGNQAIFEQVKSVLEAMGSQIYYIGSSGSGSAVKLINQLMVGIHSQAVAEAFVLGEQLGIDLNQLHEILSNSFAQSRIMDRHYTQFIAKGQYDPGFALKLLAKDMNLVKETADAQNVGLTIGESARRKINQSLQAGFSEQDMSALFAYQVEKDRKRVESETKAHKHFAVFLPMKDMDKSLHFRQQHLAFLDARRNEGKLLANGRFVDGAGGLVIYKGKSLEEVEALVKQDPYIMEGARSYNIHEWDIVLGDI